MFIFSLVAFILFCVAIYKVINRQWWQALGFFIAAVIIGPGGYSIWNETDEVSAPAVHQEA